MRMRRIHSRTTVLRSATTIAAAGLLVAAFFPQAAAAQPIQGAAASSQPVPVVTGDARVDALLARMTPDQKLTLLQGEAEAAGPNKQYQAGYLPGIPSLGIPSLMALRA